MVRPNLARSDAPSAESPSPPDWTDLKAAFEEHYLSLYRLCFLLSRRRDLAEDMAQEAFVRIAPKIHRLPSDEVSRYLHRIALNLWKNRLRRLALEAKVRLKGGGEDLGVLASPDDRTVLWEIVKRLPGRQRACIVLRYYEDLSEREVAKILGCGVGTVKSHTWRALERLRAEVADGD